MLISLKLNLLVPNAGARHCLRSRPQPPIQGAGISSRGGCMLASGEDISMVAVDILLDVRAGV